MIEAVRMNGQEVFNHLIDHHEFTVNDLLHCTGAEDLRDLHQHQHDAGQEHAHDVNVKGGS